MLNKPLYDVLRARFGRVKVTNENIRRVEKRKENGNFEATVRGEHYNVDCPICGDSKCRLSISYVWLSLPSLSTRRRVELAHCYNESCPVWEEEFYDPILKGLELAKIGMLVSAAPVVEERTVSAPQGPIRLPLGFKLLTELPAAHPALEFVLKQYPGGLTSEYLANAYNAGFTDGWDTLYPKAMNRVIFPIYVNGVLHSWQGRTICGDNPRWYLPPGFQKCVYNGDRVSPLDIPVIAEGIPAAIACGPMGVALFGKEATAQQVDYIANRWSTVIIATDPETFVPDNREGARGTIFAYKLKQKLDAKLSKPAIMLKWPAELLELGRKSNNNENVKVPDPADLGLREMARLIGEVKRVAL